jgi:hypothetical protein
MPGLPRRAGRNHEATQNLKRAPGRWPGERICLNNAGFEGEWWGPDSRDANGFSKLERTNWQILPWSIQKELNPVGTLTLARKTHIELVTSRMIRQECVVLATKSVIHHCRSDQKLRFSRIWLNISDLFNYRALIYLFHAVSLGA